MSYFGDVAGEGEVRIVRGFDLQRFSIAPGIWIQPVLGERMNVNVVTLEADAVAPVHTHEEEQLGFVVKGVCEFTDGTSTWILEPGDLYHALPNVPHGARAVGDGCVLLDLFSPPRAGIRELLEG